MIAFPYIPENITVHLGAPNAPAQNITVSFPDYIKNVASSEIYPTWPENAIRANIYAILSFTLNRIYTEWYRGRGYKFDITNSTQVDQAFVYGRDIFNNISDIVDNIFNSYVQKQGSVEPYFTQYCNGTTVKCKGLSQWGTVSLANQGKTPYEILQYYYGDNINVISDVPVKINMPSYPGIPLSKGSVGNDVRAVQIRLNRIRKNYPSIPNISIVDSVFGVETESAVKAFQKTFFLPQTGIVDKGTWYQIAYIYNAVKKLADLNSEGVTIYEATLKFPTVLKKGERGIGVKVLQYYISVLGAFNDSIPIIDVDGIFGENTENAIKEIQKEFGLNVDGVVGRETWNKILTTYNTLIDAVSPEYLEPEFAIFPGIYLQEGFEGAYVKLLQQYLNVASKKYPSISPINVDGSFGQKTKDAVIAYQKILGYTPDGVVGPILWNDLTELYKNSKK